MNKHYLPPFLILFLLQLIFASFLSSEVFAQKSVKGSKLLRAPEEYILPSGKVLQASGSTTKNYWLVYSDRNNNISTDITGNEQMNKKINFLDCFYVIGETSNRIHIVKYQNNIINTNSSRISSDDGSIDYGWVQKDNMLLWKHSLVDGRKISIKSLAVNNLEETKDVAKYIANGGVKIYYSSLMSSTDLMKKTIRSFEFLYVYKKQGSAQLVGVSESFTAGNPGDNILGWIDNAVLQPWPSRICLEPNKSDESVKERINNNILASVFTKESDASLFSQGKTGKPFWNGDSLSKPYPAEWLRLPLLDSVGGGIIKTGIITAPYDSKGNEISSLDVYNQFLKMCNMQVGYIRKINIMFVIDGSASMTDYFTSVKQAIHHCNEYIKTSGTLNQFNYGVVIYGSDNCSETVLMNPEGLNQDSTSVTQFLDLNLNKSNCPGSNNYPALFNGLNKALQEFENHAREKNLIILVSGKGNRDDSEKAKSGVVQKMVKYNCGVLAFQVNNTKEDSYELFDNQLHEIINLSNKGIAEKIKNASGSYVREVFVPDWNQDPNNPTNTEKLDYPNSSVVPGYITRAPLGGYTDFNILSMNITKIIEDCDSTNSNMISDWRDGYTGKIKTPSIDDGIMVMIAEVVKSTPDENKKEVARLLTEPKANFFIEGYTSTKSSKLNYPIYSYVLFETADEYVQLKNNLNQLIECNDCDGKALRDKLYDNYIDLLKQYYGEESENALAQKNIEDVVQALVGSIPSNNGSRLFNYKIGDIKSPKKLPQEKLTDMIEYIKNKISGIKSIENSVEYKFESYDKTYYWIPSSMLP